MYQNFKNIITNHYLELVDATRSCTNLKKLYIYIFFIICPFKVYCTSDQTQHDPNLLIQEESDLHFLDTTEINSAFELSLKDSAFELSLKDSAFELSLKDSAFCIKSLIPSSHLFSKIFFVSNLKTDLCCLFETVFFDVQFANRTTVIADTIHDALNVYINVPNTTRWNSTYNAVKCLSDQLQKSEAKVQHICDECGIPRFDKNDLAFMIDYCKTMEPLSRALDILQGDKYMIWAI
ncbi:hypothetical protein AGLY_007951 [Aphis glycines]|uniref:Uncharacterized protein n=1 Tax=Aphis glycines TaxID=307491 RepID=A0A6G0TP10_APHGL|nr:hypothetical protein AGLY_007951 [Aphis glycines]